MEEPQAQGDGDIPEDVTVEVTPKSGLKRYINEKVHQVLNVY